MIDWKVLAVSWAGILLAWLACLIFDLTLQVAEQISSPTHTTDPVMCVASSTNSLLFLHQSPYRLIRSTKGPATTSHCPCMAAFDVRRCSAVVNSAASFIESASYRVANNRLKQSVVVVNIHTRRRSAIYRLVAVEHVIRAPVLSDLINHNVEQDTCWRGARGSLYLCRKISTI